MIRVDLDRIAVKKKENEGFPVQVHPKKRRKNVRKVGWVGSYVVAE